MGAYFSEKFNTRRKRVKMHFQSFGDDSRKEKRFLSSQIFTDIEEQ